MVKRKRDDEISSKIKSNDAQVEQASRQPIDVVVRQSRQALRHALKLARGTERLKLNRRHKNAISFNRDGIPRIEAEIQACKVSCIR